jgi:choline dehydrogenase-like flavoprotein
MNSLDVLIVGSGPAGISVAWPLVKAGLAVTMFEANSAKLPPSPLATSYIAWRNNPNRWRDVLGNDLEGLVTDTNVTPKFSTPIGRAVIHHGSNFPPELHIKNAVVARASTVGGLSSIWGGFCAAFDETDMKGFPISCEMLATSYRAVAERIGLSGVMDDLSDFLGPDLLLQSPLPLNAPARHALRNYKSHTHTHSGFTLGQARNAVLTAPKSGRSACVQCGLCLYGCGHKSIYNSAYEIPELLRFSNFTYVQNAKVSKLISIGNKEHKIQVILDRTATSVAAKTFVLAAGTLNTTALLLDYYGLHGKAVRLLSNPVAGMAFIVPKFICRDFSANSFALGQLGYRLALDADHYATGVMYAADTLPLNLFASRMPFTKPVSWALSSALAPAILMTTCYLSGDRSNMQLSLNLEKGTQVLHVNGDMPFSTDSELRSAGKKLARHMARLGAHLVPWSFTVSPPGCDGHLAGTVPMGGTGPLSCTSDCELTSGKGVYVVDGAWFPSLPPKHCTFTIMANAFRVGEDIARKSTNSA